MALNYLVLEDGSVYEGDAFGYDTEAFGEVVFSTGMGGYQESLTDPSSKGQIIVMSYPLIGNYGMSDGYYQSDKVHAQALVVKEYCKEPSLFYGGKTLDDFLKKYKVPGISGIDTRDLVIKLRTLGTLRGAITNNKDEIEILIKKLKSMKSVAETNLVREVSCKEIKNIDNGKEMTVGLLDFGCRSAILDSLSSRFNITIFPYDTPSDVIADSRVNGLVVSNGPGTPMQADIRNVTTKTLGSLSTQMPMYGICFGNQAICLAMGGEIYKMKFGHHGCNQPVKFEGRVYITSQSHDFAVDENSLDKAGFIADQVNINDNSIEGTKHKDLPIFTTQYHPEASPGPMDTEFLFDRFGKVMKEGCL